MSNVERDICRKIRMLRKRAGLIQAELAEKAGLGEETISAIERGKYVPSIGTLHKIAAAFHLNLHQLFRPDEKRPPSAFEEKIQKIEAVLRSRSIEDVELVERLLRLIFKRLDEDAG